MNTCRIVAFRSAKAALFRGAKADNCFCLGPTRAGFSLLEFEVALTLLGIGLVGLFPLVVMQSRAVRSIEKRLSSQATYYLVASPNVWAQKLGAPAQLSTTPPAAPAAAAVLLVDNGDNGYSESGSAWTTTADSRAFQGQYRLHSRQTGSPDTATWQFTGLAAGWFQLQATWLASSDRSTRAVYTGYDGGTALGTYAVNQQSAPSGTTFGGCAWQTLATVWLNGPTASVSLAASSDGSVAADAARLVPLVNTVQVLSLDRAINGQQVTVQVQVHAPGSP